MVTTGAVIHGDRERLLGFDRLRASGGAAARRLRSARSRDCAQIGEDFGYDEINLNVGCPSDRVQDGRFGACLMAEPQLVADCVAAMKRAVTVPVTVKCRIGIDDQDPETALDALARSGGRGRRRRADRACPQGLAEGPVAEGEPRYPAARLRPRLSAQAGDAAACRSSSMAASAASPRRSSISRTSTA